jgi:acetyl esterase/lipase
VLRDAIANTPQPGVATMQFIPLNEAEWLAIIAQRDAATAALVPDMIEQFAVSVEKDEIEGVKVHHVIPAEVDPKHEDHLFIYVHGGAFILNSGEASLPEAILIAGRARIPVLSIDYRMAPKHPYPAALDDVMAVYKYLLSQRPAPSMVMGGSSAGGNLTLALVQQLILQGLDVPGALYAGTPGAELSKAGDSFYTNDGVDRNLVTYDGLTEAAIRLYAGDYDLNDPLISPVYGDFNGFPPTLLVTGTRDLMLSATARAHIKLRQAGAVADILVYEGVSHADYAFEAASPESLHAYAELNAFLLQHLR